MKSISEGPERTAQLEVARKIALDLLTVRQRSKQELRVAMGRRNVPSDIAEELISRFEAVALVDDRAFAQALITTRVGVNHRGKARIRQELQLKGIDREIIAECLADLEPAKEREAALQLAQRKLKGLSGLETRVAQRRLAGMLARRGFSGDTVSAVVAECLGRNELDW